MHTPRIAFTRLRGMLTGVRLSADAAWARTCRQPSRIRLSLSKQSLGVMRSPFLFTGRQYPRRTPRPIRLPLKDRRGGHELVVGLGAQSAGGGTPPCFARVAVKYATAPKSASARIGRSTSLSARLNRARKNREETLPCREGLPNVSSL